MNRAKRGFCNHSPDGRNWVGIADFNIWRVLKLLKDRPRRQKELVRAGLSKSTLVHCILPRLRKAGAISEWRHQSQATLGRPCYLISLTKKGVRLTRAFSEIGKVVDGATVIK